MAVEGDEQMGMSVERCSVAVMGSCCKFGAGGPCLPGMPRAGQAGRRWGRKPVASPRRTVLPNCRRAATEGGGKGGHGVSVRVVSPKFWVLRLCTICRHAHLAIHPCAPLGPGPGAEPVRASAAWQVRWTVRGGLAVKQRLMGHMVPVVHALPSGSAGASRSLYGSQSPGQARVRGQDRGSESESVRPAEQIADLASSSDLYNLPIPCSLSIHPTHSCQHLPSSCIPAITHSLHDHPSQPIQPIQSPRETQIIYLRATGGEVGASSALAPKIGPLGLVSFTVTD